MDETNAGAWDVKPNSHLLFCMKIIAKLLFLCDYLKNVAKKRNFIFSV